MSITTQDTVFQGGRHDPRQQLQFNKFRKLTNNILNPRAPMVLGWWNYSRLLATFVRELPAIARAGDLRPLDQSMSRQAGTFRFGGRQLSFDCAFADDVIRDGSYAFGIVREILIRNCYFKYLPADTLIGLERVVDLGANRGMFSILSAAFAKHILSIDANPDFAPVIKHNAQVNGFDHITVDTVFVGAGGAIGKSGYKSEELSALLDRHGFESVDLLKMDIEGSEFDLFAHSGWLKRVARLCMEVHREYGHAEDIVDCLRAHGFSMAFADRDLRRARPEQTFEFLYAWR
jgi:hypothetical protein